MHYILFFTTLILRLKKKKIFQVGVTRFCTGGALTLVTVKALNFALHDIDSFLHPPHLFLQVGVTGFCMGGALSLAAAVLVPEVDAAAPFYGIPKADLADVSKIKIPLQCHFADGDDVGCQSMCVLVCCAYLTCLGGNYNTDKLGDCRM